MSNLIRVVLMLTTLAAHLGAAIAWAQGPYVYPQRGQAPEQQQRDRGDCHVWATQQSGFDPTRQVAQAPPPAPPTGPQGQVLRGAARGAALGAVGGAITGDAGKGAAIGAATGTLFGAIRRRDDAMHAQAQYEQAVNQQQAANSQGTDAYNRALARLAGAAPFDGSVPLICAITDVLECDAGSDCFRRTVGEVNLPRFLKVDAKAGTISVWGAGAEMRRAPIHKVDTTTTALVLYGGQDGRGWSAVIGRETGQLSAGVVADRGGFVVSGACTVQ